MFRRACLGVVAVLLLGFLSVVGLLLYPVVFPFRAGQPVHERVVYSYGVEEEGQLYFLAEFSESRARRPVWFIMPIERSPKYYTQLIRWYRYDMDSEELHLLATLRDDAPFPSQVNAGRSKFRIVEEGIAFAYASGWDSDLGALYDLRVWDREDRAFLENDLGGDGIQLVDRDSDLYERYFGDYASPYWDNPGVVSRTDVRTMLEDVPDGQWNWPRSQ